MTRKLTITIDDRVYDGLHSVIERGYIGKFLEDLARPLVVTESLSAEYAELSADETRACPSDCRNSRRTRTPRTLTPPIPSPSAVARTHVKTSPRFSVANLTA